MPGIIYANSSSAGFNGLLSIYQYRNEDGANPDNVCAQAACATLLTSLNLQPANIATLQAIETSHPANLLGGKWGTTPHKVRVALAAYGATSIHTAETDKALKLRVSTGFPVICLIQNERGISGLAREGAHWFVVFAYDDDGVYVTNWRTVHMSWTDFKKRWHSPLSTLEMVLSFRGITSTRRAPNPPSQVMQALPSRRKPRTRR